MVVITAPCASARQSSASSAAAEAASARSGRGRDIRAARRRPRLRGSRSTSVTQRAEGCGASGAGLSLTGERRFIRFSGLAATTTAYVDGER